MMADYQKVMIVPQYLAELKLLSALDFFDLKKWISRFSLEKVEKGSKDFKVDCRCLLHSHLHFHHLHHLLCRSTGSRCSRRAKPSRSG